MIRNNISNLFNLVNHFFNIDIQDIETRSNMHGYSRTNRMQKIDSERFKRNLEENLKIYFPDLKKEVINVSETRWMGCFFRFLYSTKYYKRVLRMTYLKNKNILIFIYLKLFFCFYNLISLLRYFKEQYIFTKNIIKQASIKIYTVKGKLENYNFKNNNILYFHYERHKSFVPLGLKSEFNLIGLGFHIDFSKEELRKYNLKHFKSFKIKDIKSQRGLIGKIKLFLRFLIYISSFYKKPINILPLLTILLHYKSFLVYRTLTTELLNEIEIKKFYNFDFFEIARSIFMNTSLSNKPKINTINTMTYTVDYQLYNICADKLYVRTQKMFDSYSLLVNKIGKINFPEDNMNYEKIKFNKFKKGESLLYLATCPDNIISIKDTKNNFLLTKQIAKKLELNIIFRPHPTMTKSAIYRIYGEHNFHDVNFDNFPNLQESVNQANIISLAISTASISAINSSAICFCVGFSKYLNFAANFGLDMKSLLGSKMYSDSVSLLIKNIVQINENYESFKINNMRDNAFRKSSISLKDLLSAD
tara:strand:+ start:279 stop:1874 length:1596 start_codon:yes stop_codon:yes gene_type:complete